jgi:hypothetical protein
MMRWKYRALALPFAIAIFATLALRLSVAPMGDAIGGSLARAATSPPSKASDPAPEPAASVACGACPACGASGMCGVCSVCGTSNDDAESGDESAALQDEAAASSTGLHADPRRIAARMPAPRRTSVEESKDAGAGRASDSSPKTTIVVPASAVMRAMQKRDVSAANALAPDGSPLGARLAGVSRYRTGLRDGDVVVSVAGTRTRTVEALVAAGMQAASGGATSISGRVLRGDTTYAVILELPKPPP